MLRAPCDLNQYVVGAKKKVETKNPLNAPIIEFDTMKPATEPIIIRANTWSTNFGLRLFSS